MEHNGLQCVLIGSMNSTIACKLIMPWLLGYAGSSSHCCPSAETAALTFFRMPFLMTKFPSHIEVRVLCERKL
ncbi:hypothetical protein EV2_025499 [Malus domestica]